MVGSEWRTSSARRHLLRRVAAAAKSGARCTVHGGWQELPRNGEIATCGRPAAVARRARARAPQRQRAAITSHASAFELGVGGRHSRGDKRRRKLQGGSARAPLHKSCRSRAPTVVAVLVMHQLIAARSRTVNLLGELGGWSPGRRRSPARPSSRHDRGRARARRPSSARPSSPTWSSSSSRQPLTGRSPFYKSEIHFHNDPAATRLPRQAACCM
jgi:hypothetical protein